MTENLPENKDPVQDEPPPVNVEPEPPKEPPALTLDDLAGLDPQMIYEWVMAAKGGNPQAQQSLNKFLNFNSRVERSNLPTRNDVRILSFLGLASQRHYKGKEGNPFRDAEEVIASAFMALKSKKSDQFVEMTRQTDSVSQLTTEPEKKPRLRDKLFNNKKYFDVDG